MTALGGWAVKTSSGLTHKYYGRLERLAKSLQLIFFCLIYSDEVNKLYKIEAKCQCYKALLYFVIDSGSK